MKRKCQQMSVVNQWKTYEEKMSANVYCCSDKHLYECTGAYICESITLCFSKNLCFLGRNYKHVSARAQACLRVHVALSARMHVQMGY